MLVENLLLTSNMFISKSIDNISKINDVMVSKKICFEEQSVGMTRSNSWVWT